jgi:predicted RNA binding protein YcfA (HicA-like mRNA interferase family)
MSHIAPISWKKFEKFLFYIGCKLSRQKGDHLIYSRPDLKRPVVVPKENEIPVFVIRNNLRILNIASGEYLEILKQI